VKRLILCVVAVFAIAAVVVGCGSNNTAEPPSGNSELQGTWTGTARNSGSVVYTFTFSGDNYTLSFTGSQGSGTFTADAAANPRTIDFHITAHTTTQYIGKTVLGLYELDGANLTLALAQPPGTTPRPASLTAGMVFDLVKQ
jgi:uncharacterized protein (TIGR03067 family)